MDNIELSAEDKWDISLFEYQVKDLTYEEAIEALVKLYRLGKIKDAMLKQYTDNI